MSVALLRGDAREVLRTLPDASVQMVLTSPPYFGLRDYGVAGQIGLEPTMQEYIERRLYSDVLAKITGGITVRADQPEPDDHAKDGPLFAGLK